MIIFKVYGRVKRLLLNNFPIVMERSKSSYTRKMKTNIDKFDIKKNTKAQAKIRFNWQNSKEFGQILYPVNAVEGNKYTNIKVNTTVNEKLQTESNTNTINQQVPSKLLKVGERYYQRTRSACSSLQDATILGNKLLDKVIVENLKGIYTSSNNSSLLGDMELFISPNKYHHEFPLNDLSNYSEDYLKSASKNILGMSNCDDDCVPSVTSVIQTNNLNSISNNSIRQKLRIISNYGLSNFYAHRKEMLNIEESVHKALKDYFSGLPLADIELEASANKYWMSLSKILPDISDITLMTTKVTHPYLMYSGFIDYVGKYKDHPTLIEVYIPDALSVHGNICFLGLFRAVANLGIYKAVSDNSKVDNILLIIVDGNKPAEVFFVTKNYCKEIWKEWIERLQAYWKQRRNHPFNNYLNISSK